MKALICLSLAMLALKISGLVDIPWWHVTFPLWIFPSIAIPAVLLSIVKDFISRKM